jgi:hypothetical protein
VDSDLSPEAGAGWTSVRSDLTVGVQLRIVEAANTARIMERKTHLFIRCPYTDVRD